jgi:hypothetical protein
MTVHKESRKIPNHRWTEEEIQLVKTLSRKGWKAEEIQERRLPYLTERQITNKIYFERHKDELLGVAVNSEDPPENTEKQNSDNEKPEEKKRKFDYLISCGSSMESPCRTPNSRIIPKEPVIRPEYTLSRLGILHMHEGKNSVTIWLKQIPGMSVVFGPVYPNEVKVTIKPDGKIPTDIPFLEFNELVTNGGAGDFIFTIPTRNKLGVGPSNANRMYYPSEEEKQWIIYNIKFESDIATIFKD